MDVGGAGRGGTRPKPICELDSSSQFECGGATSSSTSKSRRRREDSDCNDHKVRRSMWGRKDGHRDLHSNYDKNGSVSSKIEEPYADQLTNL